MSVEPTGPVPLRPIQPSPRPLHAGGDPPAPPTARVGQHDRIELSAEARHLAAAEAPEERAARIAALRAAIADGTYRVDADGLAFRLAQRGEA